MPCLVVSWYYFGMHYLSKFVTKHFHTEIVVITVHIRYSQYTIAYYYISNDRRGVFLSLRHGSMDVIATAMLPAYYPTNTAGGYILRKIIACVFSKVLDEHDRCRLYK
jgi:hypothetical protein